MSYAKLFLFQEARHINGKEKEVKEKMKQVRERKSLSNNLIGIIVKFYFFSDFNILRTNKVHN